MIFDTFGLGYTRHGTSLHVHYPTRAPDGSTVYGAGFAFDHHPEIARRPDSERSQLWRTMAAPSPTLTDATTEPNERTD